MVEFKNSLVRDTFIREDALSLNISKCNFSEPSHKIPQCIRNIPHNAAFCNRNVNISVTKWCYWWIWDWCIVGFIQGSNKPISQIPQFIRQLSHNAPYHNAPFCNRHVHISLKNGAMWSICLVHCGVCEMGLYMIFSQHCKYWWHGASATEHQQKHYWLHTHVFSALYVS